MIRSLYIKNFALIDEVEIQFGQNLNIITGESGAGKSIIVNAIAQICGARGSVELVRNGSKKAIIEAVFDISDAPDLLALNARLETEPDDGQLLIRKEISQSGHSRIFMNDSPVALSTLNKISSELIDLHGQHQHQQLLHPENHLPYLDAFAGLGEDICGFKDQVSQYETLCRKERTLLEKQASALRSQDIFRFQIDEISRATEGESDLEALRAELARLNNFEKLHDAAQMVHDILYAGDLNAVKMISDANAGFNLLVRLEKEFAPFAQGLTGARETLEEIGQTCERYLNEMEFDPLRAEFLRGQIARLELLLKKYQQPDMAALLEYKNKINTELDNIVHLDDALDQLRQAKNAHEMSILEAGLAISHKRREAAENMTRKLDAFLSEIGMAGCSFLFKLSYNIVDEGPFTINGQNIQLSPEGFDHVFFLFTANPGEPAKPLHKIASGGEISRIMLALKSVLAAKDHIPVLVFDEIDSGISGKAAQIVGKKMAELSGFHQLICITHLPQIAAFATHHFKVHKQTSKSATAVAVSLLGPDDQRDELAGLLGGVTLTSEALLNAQRLLEEAHKEL